MCFFFVRKVKIISINFIMLVSMLSLAHNAIAVTYVDDDISTNRTWTLANSPYVIDPGRGGSGRVTVQSGATLTIEPGVEVQFVSSQGYMKIQGTLIAQGTPINKITFTREPDFTGSWNGIIFDGPEASSSVLQNTIVEYGGSRSTSGNGEGMITCWDGASPTISDSIIRNSQGSNDNHGIGIYADKSTPLLKNNTIQDNKNYGIVLVDSSPSITGNAFSRNESGAILLETDIGSTFPLFDGNTFNTTYDKIFVNGNIVTSGTWEYAGTSYVIDPGHNGSGRVTVQSGATLTIEPGVEVQFVSRQGYLKIQGKLIAQGTFLNKITFTREPDFTGSWNGIIFDGPEASGSVLQNTIVEYGGSRSTSGNGEGMITCWDGASPTISDSIIRNSQGSGDNHGIGVYIDDGSEPFLQNNIISNNDYYGVFNNDPSVCFDARNNYWGDPAGPLDDSQDEDCIQLYNPNTSGDKVSDYVIYDPWSRSEESCSCPDTDQDGVIDAWDDCPNTPYDTKIDKHGCSDSAILPPDNIPDAPQTYLVLTDASSVYTIPPGDYAQVYGSAGANGIIIPKYARGELMNFVGNNEITLRERFADFMITRDGATVIMESAAGTRVKVAATNTAQTFKFSDGTYKLIISGDEVLLGEVAVDVVAE